MPVLKRSIHAKLIIAVKQKSIMTVVVNFAVIWQANYLNNNYTNKCDCMMQVFLTARKEK